MSQKRMRYRILDDMPRNVSRRAYTQYQLWLIGAALAGFVSLGLLFAVLTNLTARPAQQLAQFAAMSISEAAQYSGDGVAVAKLEGFLVADDAPAMPDDAARRVIRGSLTLSARSGSESEGDTVRETLLDWEERAERVFLSDGEARIPLAFDLAILPLPIESSDQQPEIQRTGSARLSQPVAVEYGGMTLPLSPSLWENEDSAFVDVVRRVLPHGESVVVVAGVESTPDGSQLVDPLGDRLQVVVGTEEEIRARGDQLRRLYSMLIVPLGIASLVMGGIARRMRRRFVELSNQ